MTVHSNFLYGALSGIAHAAALTKDQVAALREVRDGKAIRDIRDTKHFKYERDALVYRGLVTFKNTWALTSAGEEMLSGYRLDRARRGSRLESSSVKTPAQVRRFVIQSQQWMWSFKGLAKRAGIDTARIPHSLLNELQDAGVTPSRAVKIIKRKK